MKFFGFCKGKSRFHMLIFKDQNPQVEFGHSWKTCILNLLPYSCYLHFQEIIEVLSIYQKLTSSIVYTHNLRSPHLNGCPTGVHSWWLGSNFISRFNQPPFSMHTLITVLCLPSRKTIWQLLLREAGGPNFGLELCGHLMLGLVLLPCPQFVMMPYPFEFGTGPDCWRLPWCILHAIHHQSVLGLIPQPSIWPPDLPIWTLDWQFWIWQGAMIHLTSTMRCEDT